MEERTFNWKTLKASLLHVGSSMFASTALIGFRELWA